MNGVNLSKHTLANVNSEYRAGEAPSGVLVAIVAETPGRECLKKSGPSDIVCELLAGRFLRDELFVRWEFERPRAGATGLTGHDDGRLSLSLSRHRSALCIAENVLILRSSDEGAVRSFAETTNGSKKKITSVLCQK